MKSKQELEDDFEWWITCIPDKIEKLEELLSKDIFSQLDYSISSLDILEKYLIENSSFEEIQKDKELWDCCASYLGRTYKRNIPNSKWFVELDNEKNIFYGVPILRIPNKIDFEPHSYISTALDRKKGNLWSTALTRHIELEKESPSLDYEKQTRTGR